jgi:DNA-binding response OmpR family regulator
MRILAVEDDNVTRMVLEALLLSLGHQVVMVEDGEEAWAVLSKEKVEVVISDWELPGLSGLELCSRIRGQTDLRNLYFILLTKSAASIENGTRAREAGVDDFLVKPVSLQDLMLRLNLAQRSLKRPESET